MNGPSLHSVLVFAPDLAAARRFYVDILGFSIAVETDAHIELSGADFSLTIFRCESSASAEGYSERAGTSIAISTPDLAGEVQRLRSHGVTILHDEPASGPVGRYVAFVDPFGTVHELVECAR